jgi:hypothetical protein
MPPFLPSWLSALATVRDPAELASAWAGVNTAVAAGPAGVGAGLNGYIAAVLGFENAPQEIQAQFRQILEVRTLFFVCLIGVWVMHSVVFLELSMGQAQCVFWS